MPKIRGIGAFKPTEQKIVDLLSDGLRHERSTMLECLLTKERDVLEGDSVVSVPNYNSLGVQIHSIRKKLNPKGYDIACELRWRQIHYRMVRLLPCAYDGS